MNIFVLNKNPKKSARMLCDQHVVKMILESAQMLCTAQWQTKSKAPYKSTHVNHPCTIWVRESVANYKWLLEHALELCKEFEKRFKKIHKTKEVILWCAKNIPKIKNKFLTEFVQAMPKQYKHKNPVIAYKNYYIAEKLKFARWKLKKPAIFK